MSLAISAIKKHLQKQVPSAPQGATISELVCLHDDQSHRKAVTITQDIHRALINELRADLMQVKGDTVEDLFAAPTIEAWLAEGMGLAHSFHLGSGNDPLSAAMVGHGHSGVPVDDKFGDSIFEEMWRYLDWKPKVLPEGAVRGILSDEGLITELSGVITGLAKLSLARCFARSCPSILESRNWHHFEEAKHGHEKRKANFSSGLGLNWLPILSFDVLGVDAYFFSNNYANNHGAAKRFSTPLQLLTNKINGPEDTDLLDAFVEQICKGWSDYQLNKALSNSIDLNKFWRNRTVPEANLRSMERYWSSRAAMSLEGDKFDASWTVNLAMALYTGNCPENRSRDVEDRLGHLAEVMARNPEMAQIFEYLNQNAGWLLGSNEYTQSDIQWTDEAFLSFMSEESRHDWLDGISKKVSKFLIRAFKQGRQNYHTPEQVAAFFNAQHPDYARMLCTDLRKNLSFGRMSRDFPSAGTTLAQMAIHDLKRPEHRQEAADLVNSVRSEIWKLFLLQDLGVSPSEVKLTARQRDIVFAGDLGL